MSPFTYRTPMKRQRSWLPLFTPPHTLDNALPPLPHSGTGAEPPSFPFPNQLFFFPNLFPPPRPELTHTERHREDFPPFFFLHSRGDSASFYQIKLETDRFIVSGRNFFFLNSLIGPRALFFFKYGFIPGHSSFFLLSVLQRDGTSLSKAKVLPYFFKLVSPISIFSSPSPSF